MLAPALTIGGLSLATLALLGFSCPGCGGLRAVNDLTNGDLGAALSSNLLVVLLIPVAVVLLLVWARDRWVGVSRAPAWSAVRPVVISFLVVLVAFTVFRNTSAGAWFAP